MLTEGEHQAGENKKAAGPEEEAYRFRPITYRSKGLNRLSGSDACSGLEVFSDYVRSRKKPHRTIDGPCAAQNRSTRPKLRSSKVFKKS